MVLLATDWTAVGDQASHFAVGLVGWGGPLLLTGLLVYRIARAASRRDRYRAVRVLSEADRESVRAAVVAAERRTVGEILPVVVERSDPHPAADWLAAAIVALVGTALLGAHLPWDSPVLVVLVQVLLGALGFWLVRALPDFKRSFVAETRATSVAQEQALQEFFGNGLHKTEAETGVLLFVSLFEHRVIVLADEGIASQVPSDAWVEVDAAILKGVRSGSLRDGLIEGIERAADVLAEKFPWHDGDRNEVPDRLIVRAE